jgi:hypothetical protein
MLLSLVHISIALGFINTKGLENRCALMLRYIDLVVSIATAVEVCCCFTVFGCWQWLKCNTGKVCNCLIQFNLGSGLYRRS